MITSCKAHAYIESLKDVCGGEPVVAGTRIPVKTIINWIKMGKEVDEIVAMYPNITHAMVYDVLSYYYDHKDEIDRLIAEGTKESQLKLTEGEGWRKQSYILTRT
ncbi:MAG: hypothetical protein A2X55_11805 [Nitrospirae bacterium GWB2_47_37]|nr:MAG: hypothetical protein A2Z82_09630 [Nitrospirae bacterium GWA2_46_11]OGW25163.1 MAG: hypothetical protein A2X55_11805 [Nitrospirae bacterium GWB2_47_37]